MGVNRNAGLTNKPKALSVVQEYTAQSYRRHGHPPTDITSWPSPVPVLTLQYTLAYKRGVEDRTVCWVMMAAGLYTSCPVHVVCAHSAADSCRVHLCNMWWLHKDDITCQHTMHSLAYTRVLNNVWLHLNPSRCASITDSKTSKWA